MLNTTLQGIRYILQFLLYYPKAESIDSIMCIIENEAANGKSIWRIITNAIEQTVGQEWDTALIIAASLCEPMASPLQRTLQQLDLKILTDREERKLVSAIFASSRLKALLTTGKPAEIVVARNEFMIEVIDQVSIFLFANRDDLLRMARSKAKIHRAVWLPHTYEGDDDYFSEAYITLRSKFFQKKIFPQNFSALMVILMCNQILISVTSYENLDLVAVIEKTMIYNDSANDNTNDSANDSVIDRAPDVSFNPVVPVELKETVVLILTAFNEAVSDTLRIGSKTVRRRRVFILYHLSEDPDTRPSRSEIAATLSVSISTVDKTIEFCRKILGEKCVQHGLPPAAFENFVNSKLL